MSDYLKRKGMVLTQEGKDLLTFIRWMKATGCVVGWKTWREEVPGFGPIPTIRAVTSWSDEYFDTSGGLYETKERAAKRWNSNPNWVPPYPEHYKRDEHNRTWKTIDRFIEWIAWKGYRVGKYQTHESVFGQPVSGNFEDPHWVDGWFPDISHARFEAEQEAMEAERLADEDDEQGGKYARAA